MVDYKKYFTERNLTLLLLIFVGIIAFFMIRPYMVYLVIALILTFVSYPLFERLVRKVHNRGLASFIMVAILFLIVIVPTALFVYQLINEASIMLSTTSLLNADQELKEIGVNSTLGSPMFKNILIASREKILAKAPNLLSQMTSIFLGFFIMLFAMYYLFKEWPEVRHKLKKLLPFETAHKDYLLEQIKISTKGIMYGQLLTALSQGLAGGLGLFIFGVPRATFWTFIMIVLSIIPLVGPFLVWIPAAVYLYFNGHVGAAIGLAIYGVVIVSNIDNVIRPMLISGKVGIHPIAVLIGVFGGIALFGLIGIFVGPLIFAIFSALMKCYTDQPEVKGNDEQLHIE